MTVTLPVASLFLSLPLQRQSHSTCASTFPVGPSADLCVLTGYTPLSADLCVLAGYTPLSAETFSVFAESGRNLDEALTATFTLPAFCLFSSSYSLLFALTLCCCARPCNIHMHSREPYYGFITRPFSLCLIRAPHALQSLPRPAESPCKWVGTLSIFSMLSRIVSVTLPNL